MSILNRFRVLKKLTDDAIREASNKSRLGDLNITIGENTFIADNCNVGKYCYVGSYTRIEIADIGNYVSIGDNVTIAPGEHRTKWISTSYKVYKDRIGEQYYNGDDSKCVGGCKIGNDVWIGNNSTIRRGITIGNGAVVGANSYVNRDVPDFAIVGGDPANLIRYRFDSNTINAIERSHWWDYDLDDARIIIRKLEEDLSVFVSSV